MSKVFLISGNDEPRVSERARAVVDQLVGPDADEFSLETHRETDETTPAEAVRNAVGAVLTPSMFGGAKTVWLRDFPFANEGSAADLKAKQPLALALNELLESIQRGLPDEINLVMSGQGLMKNRRIYKTLQKLVKIEFLNKPELNNRNWRANVSELLRHAAAERGMQLPRGAIEYLTEVIGVDTARIPNECEKVYCYAGNQPTLEQIREICVGNREAVFYALTDGFGSRDLNAAFRTMSQFLGHTKDPESAVIGQVRLLCKYFRQLLHIKLLTLTLKTSPSGLEAAIGSLSETQRTELAYYEAISMSTWQLRRMGEAAGRYKGSELVDAVSLLARADRMSVSSSVSRRTILETLATRIILGDRATA